MIVQRCLPVLLVFSGCGSLELGSYPEPDPDGSEGPPAHGGTTSVSGSFSLGGNGPSGGNPGSGGSLGSSAGFGGAASGGFAGSANAGSGFAGDGVAGTGFGGTSGPATGGNGVGGSGDGGSGNDPGNGGSSGSLAGGGSGGSATGDGSGGASGGGIGGGSGGTGGGVIDQSCRGLEGQCSAHFNCCASSFINTEEFVLGWDQFSVSARVTLFYPDALEVTVGRFARFVEAFEEWTKAGHPRPGAGEHTFIPGTGWQSDWPLPASREALEAAVTSCAFVNTYAVRDTNPELPMNCVSWFEAFAFCAWDGKRLLTEAEWELAAKGGVEDRVYPWGSEPEPTPDHAVYGCFAAGLSAPHCDMDDVLSVGSRTLGNSRHGLRDLAGSVAEWVFDKEGPYADPCFDCANIESEHNPNMRMFRGGDYSSAPVLLAAERRNGMDAAGRVNFIGFRCARSLLHDQPKVDAARAP